MLDFYGALLTPKQQKCLELHYLNDFSLAEIADEFAVSRQAVYDILHRSELILESYESKLKLVERYQTERKIIEQVIDLLNDLSPQIQSLTPVSKAKTKLKLLLDSYGEG